MDDLVNVVDEHGVEVDDADDLELGELGVLGESGSSCVGVGGVDDSLLRDGPGFGLGEAGSPSRDVPGFGLGACVCVPASVVV